MALDFTKYNLYFSSPIQLNFENLNKRQLVLETIRYVLQNNLISQEVLNNANLNPTHNKQLIVNELEYNNFSVDKTKRYTLIEIDKNKYYISNQWRKSTIDGFIDYFEDKIPDTIEFTELYVEDEETEIASAEENEYPLNQIFYGPPGTGKTYHAPIEAVNIINHGLNSAKSREEKFNIICDCVRAINGLETKANSLYRNDRAIMWIFGYLLDTPFDQNNSLSNTEAIGKGMDSSPSTWSQYSQYITQFGFVDNWRNSTLINLNSIILMRSI